MDWSRVLGFATDAGSRTYHTAILARSLKVPAVVGLRDVSRRVRPGTPVIVDGATGLVTIDPSPAQIEDAQHRAPARHRRHAVAPGPPEPALTADGVPVRLDANMERLEDVPALIEAGAEGVGLFRTEFLLAGRAADRLTEDEQVEIYRGLLGAVAPRPVTIRTFDLDERQHGPWSSRDRHDARPGLRGVRLGLARPEVLTTQLRALLRAAPAGRLRVMFPFVTSVEEMRGATALMRASAERAGYTGVPRTRRGHGRGAVGGAGRRSAGARVGILHHRHQRSDPVHPGGRSHRRTRVGAVRAAASGGAAPASAGAPGRHPAAHPTSRCAARWPRTRR